MNRLLSQRTKVGRSTLSGLLLAALLLAGAPAVAQEGEGDAAPEGVQVVRGPTPIPNGNALADGDLTVRNEHLAFAVAAESAPPWGVARGGIVDAAPVVDGEIQVDRLSLVDLIPNNWSSWPTSYQEIEVTEESDEQVTVRTERDWGDVVMVSTWTLEADSTQVHMTTTMTNEGDEAQEAIQSGYVLWPDAGSWFGTPATESQIADPSSERPDWSLGYDEDWTFALHAPYFDTIQYDGMDLYLEQTLEPGDSQDFEAWFQVLPEGDTSEVVAAEIEREGTPSGTLSGEVRTEGGDPVEEPVVVVRRNDEPYVWNIGDAGAFEFELPAGEYTVYATAAGHAQSTETQVEIEDGDTVTAEFGDLRAPSTVVFDVSEEGTGDPLDARIDIAEGESPEVEFLGRDTFFTDLDEVGRAEFEIAPGEYVFEVSSGAGFVSQPTEAPLTVEPGEVQEVVSEVETLARPASRDWYAIDGHHHADVLEGVTPPEYVMRSQLAARLDLTFLSDHDSAENNVAMHRMSRSRGVPFIPSIEMSPSWGHFNPFPLELGTELTIDTGAATVSEVFAESRRMGGEVISVNHPYIPYGYFNSLNEDAVPGPFDPEFDLIELNGMTVDQPVQKAWSLWNRGERVYFNAGTDVHNVWTSRSGAMRMFGHVEGELTPESFTEALAQGRGYASQGPLIDPQPMFGDTVRVVSGETADLGFSIQAVDGLAEIRLVSEGEVIDSVTPEDGTTGLDVTFGPTVEEDTWFALVVEDADGHMAYSNPIWADAVEHVQDVGGED